MVDGCWLSVVGCWLLVVVVAVVVVVVGGGGWCLLLMVVVALQRLLVMDLPRTNPTEPPVLKILK